jgi:ribosomal protein L3 glutamine methyltransferase
MNLYDENDYQDLETIQDMIRYAYSRSMASDIYYGHGTNNAWDEMRQLILDSLSLAYDVPDQILNCRLSTKEKQFLFTQLSQRLNARIPVPYLTKKAYFCDLEFYVDERVLIPRSPIAELIRQGFSPWIQESQVHRILDMCTGSACIAIACCYAFPDAEVDAVDISENALAVAEINRHRHALEGALNLIQSDCFDTLSEKKYDLIIANPPYVGHDEILDLPEEYKHEPQMALEAEDNGMALVEKILKQAVDYLSDDGILIMEVGNSEPLVDERFPDLALTWLDFEYGGQGVFLVSSKDLSNYFARKR